MSDPNMSAQPCGCDPGEHYLCAIHAAKAANAAAAYRDDVDATLKVLESSDAAVAADMPYAAAVQAKIDRHADALIRAHQANLLVVNKKLEQGIPTLPKGQKPTNAKGPFATNKVPLSLVPSAATALCALALADGGAKYGIANYRAAGVSARIYIDALMRHIAAWYDGGEDVADDSGVPHLGHAMACLAILIDAETHGVLTDDRPMSNTGLATLMEQSQSVIAAIRARHADKRPRHYTIGDNGIGTVPDPKTRTQEKS